MFCPYCGKEIVEGAAFCGACGQRIRPAGAQPQNPQQNNVQLQNPQQPARAQRREAEQQNTAGQGAHSQPANSNAKKKFIILGVIAAVLVLAAVFAAVFFASPSKADQFQEQIDLGEQYLAEENYEQAIVAYTAAIEIDEQQADAYMARAEAYTSLAAEKASEEESAAGTQADAAEEGEDAAAETGEDAAGAAAEENLDKALADYRTVIALEPERTEAYIRAADIYTEYREEYESAEEILEDGLAENPGDEELTEALEEVEELLEEAEWTGRYQAYSDKLAELEEMYGEAKLERMDETVTYDAGDGYQLYTYYWTGLFFAHLVDMDGDGTEELITGYYDPEKADTSSGYSLLTTGYTIDIWTYADGDLQRYSLSPSQIGWSAEEGYIECQIGLTDDAAYVISADESGDLTRYEYYGLTDGTVEQIHSFNASSSPIIVDGQEYENYEDVWGMLDEWLAELIDTQYWYFGGQYVLQEDISWFESEYEAELAPAEEELESTLSALSAYLSTSSEEADDGYAALTADWSDDWHDYDVNLFEYDGAGEFTLLSTRDYDYETDTIF